MISLRELMGDTTSTAGVLMEYDGEYLLCLRASRKSLMNPSKWSIPKGHIREGESPLEGALRELCEETKITLAGTPHLLLTTTNKEGGAYYIYGYQLSKRLEPILDEEHIDFGYFPINNLPNKLDKGLRKLFNSYGI